MKVKDVDITTMSNEELDKLLDEAGSQELDTLEDDYEVVTSEIEQPEETTEPPPETPEPETAEPAVETKAETPEPTQAEKDKLSYEQLLAKVKELEAKTNQPPAPPPPPTPPPPPPSPIDPEELYKDPDAAIEKKVMEIEARRLAEQEKQYREFNRLTEQTKSVILQVEPSFEEYVPEMADYLKTQGVNEGLIEAFKQNPYAAHNPHLLRMMCDVAKAKRALSKPAVTPQPSKKVPPMETSAARPGTIRSEPAQRTITPAEIARLSDAELDQIISKGRIGL